MEEQRNEFNRPVNPRRRKRTKLQIFKEAYLPLIIIALALILIIVFIAGSITRAVQKAKAEKEASIAASSSLAEEEARLKEQAASLLMQAEDMAAGFDYEGAIAALNSFEGDMKKYPEVYDKLVAYESAFNNTVVWDDPSSIPNLSFQLLIADPSRAFSNSSYGYSINKNFITTEEFSKILQQLFDNGYILVDFDDFVTVETGADGLPAYKAKSLRLPNGKKPIMLTQTNVNYNYYLIDSDGDKIPDKNGCGFASKLLWDGSKFICEMVDASGQTVTGAYDLVPILEDFIEKHPSFSYKGARATLALTGYNGLFGHRTHANAASIFGDEKTRAAIQNATTVAEELQNHGYKLSCYTYENIPYGTSSLTEIQTDMNAWTNEVIPILGNFDIFTFAQLTDITGEETYAGDKYETLKSMGFRYYLGFCEDGKPWATIAPDYVRQGRIMVTGANLAYHSDWFISLFDPTMVLDTNRGQIPQ